MKKRVHSILNVILKCGSYFDSFDEVLDLCDVFTLNSALSASERVTLWRSALSTLAATATSQSTPEISKRRDGLQLPRS